MRLPINHLVEQAINEIKSSGIAVIANAKENETIVRIHIRSDDDAAIVKAVEHSLIRDGIAFDSHFDERDAVREWIIKQRGR